MDVLSMQAQLPARKHMLCNKKCSTTDHDGYLSNFGVTNCWVIKCYSHFSMHSLFVIGGTNLFHFSLKASATSGTILVMNTSERGLS
jgi:hypothetical protein